MKKLLPLLFFVIMASAAAAQLKVGFLGGANRSTILETNSIPNWSSIIKPNYSPLYGAHGGVFAEIPLNKKGSLVFQPGAIYFNKGRKYKQQFDTAVSFVADSSSALRLNYIDIPFNLIIKFNLGKKVKFMIGAGPYVSFFFNGNEKTETHYKDGTSTSASNTDLPVGNGPGQLKTMDYGANVMAGFEFGHAFLRADASQSLGDFFKANYDGSFKHQVISASIGFTIDLKNTSPEKKKPAKKTEPKPEKEARIKDKDADGVADKDDKCPKDPGTAATQGCPDKDGDGVADKDDKCPDVAGLASNNGCPAKDTDGDGVPDDTDKCPNVKGDAKNNGCPVEKSTTDTDHDGINDDVDKCPAVFGLYRYDGCPIPDTDGDGVNDEIDHCKTVPGLASNHGCPAKAVARITEKVNPEITEEMAKTVDESAGKIQFKQSQTDLSPEAMAALDKVAEILRNKPSLRLQIDGYASKEGEHYINLGLSNSRANAVRDYLLSKGIDKSRLKTAYYGADRLITGDLDKQHVNRRVELTLH